MRNGTCCEQEVGTLEVLSVRLNIKQRFSYGLEVHITGHLFNNILRNTLCLQIVVSLVLEYVLKFHCVLLAIIVDQFNPIVVQHIPILIDAPRKTDSAEFFVAFFQELNHSIHDKSHDINRFPHAVSNRPSIGGISDQNACNVIIIGVGIEIFACFC